MAKWDLTELIEDQQFKNLELSETKKANLRLLYEGEEKNQQRYIKSIKNQCYAYDINVTEHDIEKYGCLPKHTLMSGSILPVNPLSDIHKKDIIEHMNPKCDVDNYIGNTGIGCTVEAVMKIMKHFDLMNKSICVIGRNLGKDIFNELVKHDASPTLVHSKTPDFLFRQSINNAEVVISCVGKKDFQLKQEHLCYTNYVINVGLSDVDKEIINDEEHHCKVTPVKGGVGALTTQILMNRILKN